MFWGAHQDGGAAFEAAFIYACLWSCGAGVTNAPERPDRARFDHFLKTLSGLPTKSGDTLDPGALPEGSLYDYLFDSAACQWRSWASLVPKYEPPADGRFASILVPTTDTVRSSWILDTLLASQRAVLFVGSSGTAKTVTTARRCASF